MLHVCSPQWTWFERLLNSVCSSSVLSWEGEHSAISRDAIEDVRSAKYDTVIDEWDEEFDSGKVSYFKNFVDLQVLDRTLLKPF